MNDLDIARKVELQHISKIAENFGINADDIEMYGKHKAKLPLSFIDEKRAAKSNLILVSAISPTPAGEGKMVEDIFPSKETLDFLAQLFISDRSKSTRCEQHLAAWLAEYDPQSTRLIFHVWLLLTNSGKTVPYQSMALAGEDLFQWQIKGREGSPLQLHDVAWQGTRLDPVAFDYVAFGNCNFSRASMWQAEFQHCHFETCRMDQADLTASTWRLNNLRALDVSSCQLSHSQWVRNQERAWGSELAHNQRTDQRIPEKVWAQLTAGHTSGVNCVVFSPNGASLLLALVTKP